MAGGSSGGHGFGTEKPRKKYSSAGGRFQTDDQAEYLKYASRPTYMPKGQTASMKQAAYKKKQAQRREAIVNAFKNGKMKIK